MADENDVDVTFHLREKPRFAAQTGTWAGDGEATAQMSARAENLFGGAERIEGVLEAGTRTRNAWEVKFQSPIAANPQLLGELSIFGMARDYKFFASHELLQRGAHAKLKVCSISPPFLSILASLFKTFGIVELMRILILGALWMGCSRHYCIDYITTSNRPKRKSKPFHHRLRWRHHQNLPLPYPRP